MAKRWSDSVTGVNEALAKVAKIVRRQIDRIDAKSTGTDLEAFDIGALDKYVNMLVAIDKSQRDNEAVLAKRYAGLSESELVKLIGEMGIRESNKLIGSVQDADVVSDDAPEGADGDMTAKPDQ
jgi:hypothetical protein